MSRSPDNHNREYNSSRHSVKREPESRDEYLRSTSSSRQERNRESRRYDSEDEYETRRIKQEKLRDTSERHYSRESSRSRDDRRSHREGRVPQEEPQDLSTSQRSHEDGGSRRKKSHKHHKHSKSPRSHKTHESPRKSRWDQSLNENREISLESKKSRLYRNDQGIRPPPRVKQERDDDIEMVECSNNKLRTQKRRLEKKLARIQPIAAPTIVVLDEESDVQKPPPPPCISQPQISVIPPENLLLPPVKKFDEEYMVPDDEFQQEAPMDAQYSDCIQSVAFGNQPPEYHQPQAQEPSPEPQFFQPPQYVEQPQYVPQPQVVTERYFKKEFVTPKQQIIQPPPVPQQQFIQQSVVQQQFIQQSVVPQLFIQQSAVPQVEYYEEEERKPLSNFPSVQIPQVVQVQSLTTPEIISYDIEAICKSCRMIFIHSCKYPPSTDTRSIFLEPGRLKNCKCSVIFLHTRQQCQQNITKFYVQSKNETSLVKQVDRIHKYECCDCNFKCTISGIRASSHYFESLTRKDGSLRDKGKKIERDLQAILRRVDDISKRKYPNEPPSVQQTHVDIRRCLISMCNQSCCVLYHECPPKTSSDHNDDDV